MSVPTKVFLSFLLAVAAALTALTLVRSMSDDRSRAGTADVVTAAVDLKPIELGRFEMTERSGEQFSFKELKGKVWIASLFFSSCPHECRELNDTIAALHRAPEFKDVQFISISVDPVTDTPAVLSEYAKMFDANADRWLFLHGKMGDVSEFGKQINVASTFKTHTRDLILVDETGKVRGHFGYNDGVEIDRLRELATELVARQQTGDSESEPQS